VLTGARVRADPVHLNTARDCGEVLLYWNRTGGFTELIGLPSNAVCCATGDAILASRGWHVNC